MYLCKVEKISQFSLSFWETNTTKERNEETLIFFLYAFAVYGVIFYCFKFSGKNGEDFIKWYKAATKKSDKICRDQWISPAVYLSILFAILKCFVEQTRFIMITIKIPGRLFVWTYQTYGSWTERWD